MNERNKQHAETEKVVTLRRTSVSSNWDDSERVIDYMRSFIDPDLITHVANVVCLRMNMGDRYVSCPRTMIGQMVSNFTDDVHQLNEIYDDGSSDRKMGCKYLESCRNEDCETCMNSCIRVFDLTESNTSIAGKS